MKRQEKFEIDKEVTISRIMKKVRQCNGRKEKVD